MHYVSPYACLYVVCMYECMYVCMYVYMYTYVCMYVYMHVCIYTCIIMLNICHRSFLHDSESNLMQVRVMINFGLIYLCAKPGLKPLILSELVERKHC